VFDLTTKHPNKGYAFARQKVKDYLLVPFIIVAQQWCKLCLGTQINSLEWYTLATKSRCFYDYWWKWIIVSLAVVMNSNDIKIAQYYLLIILPLLVNIRLKEVLKQLTVHSRVLPET
jgi:hypothetical protein